MLIHIIDFEVVIETAVIEGSIFCVDDDISVRPENHIGLVTIKTGRKKLVRYICDTHFQGFVDGETLAMGVRDNVQRLIGG